MDAEKHTLLLYEYVDDIIERRGPYRDAHLALLQQLKDSGTVLMAGALGDPVTGAGQEQRGRRARGAAADDPHVEPIHSATIRDPR